MPMKSSISELTGSDDFTSAAPSLATACEQLLDSIMNRP
jgi:hypothetical protein